jgi:hypothetical protein
MSADTFIGIGRFPNWYRVTNIEQAPDNLSYWDHFDNLEEFINEVNEYFCDSEVFKTLELAMDKAMDVERKFNETDDFGMWLEYWIVKYKFDFKI